MRKGNMRMGEGNMGTGYNCLPYSRIYCTTNVKQVNDPCNIMMTSVAPQIILHEVDNILVEFVHEWSSLFLPQVFETSFKDMASAWVGRQLKNAALESENETQTISWHMHSISFCTT